VTLTRPCDGKDTFTECLQYTSERPPQGADPDPAHLLRRNGLE